MMVMVPLNHGSVVVINFQLFFGGVCVLANQAVSPLGFLDRLYHQELASNTGVQPRSEGIIGLKIPFLGVNLNLGGKKKKKKKGPKTIVIYEDDDDNDDDESRKPSRERDRPREGRDRDKGRRRKKNGRYFGKKRKLQLDDNRGISVNITKDEVSKGINKEESPKEKPIHGQKSSNNADEKRNMKDTNVSKEKTSLRKQQNVINTDTSHSNHDLNENDSSTENLPEGSFAVKTDIKSKETKLTANKEPSTGKNQKSLKIRDHKEVKNSMIKLDDSSQGSGTKEDHETSSDDTEKQDIKLEKMNNNSEKSKDDLDKTSKDDTAKQDIKLEKMNNNSEESEDDLHKTSKDDTGKQDIKLEKVNNSSEESKDDLHKTSSDDTAKQDINLEKLNNSSEESKDDLHETSKDDTAKQDIKLEKVNNSSEETEVASLKDLWIETEDTEQVDTQDETEEKETKESTDEEHSKLENENHPVWLESSQNETQNGPRTVSDDELNEKNWPTEFPSANGKPVPENSSKQENKEGVEGKRYEYKLTSPDKKKADIIHTQAMEEPDKKLEQESTSSTNDGEITILVHKD